MISVTNITVKIGDKELNLSVDDAKSLFNELNNLFGYRYNLPYYPYYGAPITLTNSTNVVDTTPIPGLTTSTNGLGIVK